VRRAWAGRRSDSAAEDSRLLVAEDLDDLQALGQRSKLFIRWEVLGDSG